MVELTKNQKVFFGGLIVVIVAVICYYIMTKSTVVDYSEVDNMNNEMAIKAETQEKEVVIHIIGCVLNEGIVKVKEGSRIADVIEEAGGSTADADFSKVNLAYVVQDGQKIYIPSVYDEQETEDKKTEQEYISSTSGNNVVVENKDINNNSVQKGDGKVNINTATIAELITLPGIGNATAEKIIEYRNENQQFESIEDIKNVNGIGEAKFNNIKDKITI